PPGICRIGAESKWPWRSDRSRASGGGRAAPHLLPAPGTALGLLPSRALSSAQVEDHFSARAGLGKGETLVARGDVQTEPLRTGSGDACQEGYTLVRSPGRKWFARR